MKKYPKTIYVQVQNEGTNNEYLEAQEECRMIPEDGKVAIYELKKVMDRRTNVVLK